MTRISLNGQGTNGAGDGPITIDRSFPGLLSGAMSESEWTSFCDKIDETLAPTNSLRQQALRLLLSLLLTMVIVIFIYSLITSIGFSIGFRSSSGILYVMYNVFWFIGIVIILVVNYRRVLPVFQKLQQNKNDFEQICKDETKKRPNVLFHVKDELLSIGSGENRTSIYYIECTVRTMGLGRHTGSQAPPPPVAPTSLFDPKINDEPEVAVPSIVIPFVAAVAVSSGEVDVADRLKRLDAINDIITEEEYTQKRKEILAEI